MTLIDGGELGAHSRSRRRFFATGKFGADN